MDAEVGTMRITVVAFAATLAALSLARIGSEGPRPASPGWLVSQEWLAQNLFDSDLRVIDVRRDVHAYLAGHVPGAVHLREAALRGPSDGLPDQYLPPHLLTLMLERAGVANGSRVVVYADGEDVVDATMVAYLLEKLGHDAHVLDGGYRAWSASRMSSQGYASPWTTRLRVGDVAPTGVDVATVRRLLARPGSRTAFVDARPESAFRGQERTWMRNGHIPGARNVEWRRLVHPENPHRFRAAPELRAVFAEKGLGPGMDIVLYCGTSREASLEYGVLRHVLGFGKVRLYEGSWTEYAAHAELDVERGPEPPPATVASLAEGMR
jgi:thiosulfate/3-mercaptopyruvate sulfurtransferase